MSLSPQDKIEIDNAIFSVMNTFANELDMLIQKKLFSTGTFLAIMSNIVQRCVYGVGSTRKLSRQKQIELVDMIAKLAKDALQKTGLN